MNCRKCSSARVLSCFGKSNDCNGFHIQGEELDDQCYVLRDCNIGGGDCYAFDLCLDCGQVQGDWPVPPLDFELRKTQGGVCDRCMGDDTCVCVGGPDDE